MNFAIDNSTASPSSSDISLTLPNPTAASDAPDLPLYTCLVYRIVLNGGCQSALYVIAAVGNVLCFLTWHRLGRRKGFNSSVILIQALAVADLLTQMPLLYIYIIPKMLQSTGNFDDPFLTTTTLYSSKYGWPIASFGNFCTVMFTTLMTIHQYCVLSRPFSTFTRKLTSVTSTLIQIVCIVVIGIAYQIPRILSIDIVDVTDKEDGSMSQLAIPSSLARRADYQLWYMTISYIVLFNMLPLFLSAVFTILILHLLAKARKARMNMTSNVSSKRENSITVILLTVVILFIVCQLPNTVVRVYMALRPTTQYTCGSVIFYLYHFGVLCVSLNSSINIFIYARNKEFRNVLKGMCCCGKREDVDNKDRTLSVKSSSLSASKIDVAIVESPV